MVDLSKATEEQLQQELDKRKAKRPVKPPPKVHPNFDELRKTINNFLDDLLKDGFSSDDYWGYGEKIFEAAVNSYYEPEIWEDFILPMAELHQQKEAQKKHDELTRKKTEFILTGDKGINRKLED